MNMVLSNLSFVKNIYVAPTGTDESLSIGACYYLNKINNKPLNIFRSRNQQKKLTKN